MRKALIPCAVALLLAGAAHAEDWFVSFERVDVPPVERSNVTQLIDAGSFELVDASLFGRDLAVGHGDHGEVSRTAERRGDVLHEGREHRILELAADQADDVATRRLWFGDVAVAEVLECGNDASARRFGDTLAAVEHPADRRLADAAERGDLLERWSA